MQRHNSGKPEVTQPSYGAGSPEYSQPDPSAICPEEYPSLPTPDESQRLDRIYRPAASAGDNIQQPDTAQPSSHHVPATVRPKSQRQMKAEAGKKKKRSKSKSRGNSNSSNISTGQQHAATPEVGSNVTVSTSASDSNTDQPTTADAVTTPTPPAPGEKKVNTKHPTTSTTKTAAPAYQLIAISSTTSTADDAMDTNTTADVALPEKRKKDILKVKINKKKRTHDEPTDMAAKRCRNTTPTTTTTTSTAAPSGGAVSMAVVTTVAKTNICGNLTTSTTTTHNPKPRGKGNQIQMSTISTGAANNTSLQSGTKESPADTAAAKRCSAKSAEEAAEAINAPTNIIIAAPEATTASSQMTIDNTPKTLTLINNILNMQSENNGQPDISMLPTSQSTDHSDHMGEHGSQQLSQQTETTADNSHMKSNDSNNSTTEKGQPMNQNICNVESNSASEGEVECIEAPQRMAPMSAADIKIPHFDPDTVSDDKLGDVLLALKQRRILAYQEAVNQLPHEVVRQYNQLEEDVNRRWRLMDQKLVGKPEPPPYPNHPALTLPPEIPNADDQTVVPTEPTFPRRRHKYHLALETATTTATRLTSDEEFSDDDYTGKLEWFCKTDWAMGAPNQGVLALRPEALERMKNKQFKLVCFTNMKIHCLRGDVRHYNDATRRGYFMLLLTKLNRRVLREVTALLERAPTGTWTIHLPMHLATGYPRQRTQHLQLRAMDMYFTVARRKFDNHNQETTMEVHQTVLELRVYLQTLLDEGGIVTFLMFAEEVTRREAGLRDHFLRCEVCEGVSILLLYTKYENLIRHLVWQLHQTLSAAMTSLQNGVERVDPLIRLPLNEYPDLDTETATTKKERRRQRKMVCANELRDTSLVNSQVARDIRELYRLGQAWQQNQRHWAINIQVARAAQIRQLAHWVQRMLTVYVNANNVPEILHGLVHDWTEEQSQGAIQAHIHQTPLQCHDTRNQQMLASQQYHANYMARVNAARLLPPVVPPPVTPPLPTLDWANVPVIRYQRRELLPANQQQQPIAPNQPPLPNPAKETPKQPKEQGSTNKENNGKYPPGNQQQPKSKSVHQRIGQSNVVPEQDQEQRGYTPHSTDEEARRSITPANQQRRREDGEVSSNNEYRPPPTGSIEIPHGSSRPQAQQQLQSNSTRIQQPRFGGQWIGLQPTNLNQPPSHQASHLQQQNRTGQGYSSDYGPPGSNRPPSRRTYRPPQDGYYGRDEDRDRNGRDRDRRDKPGSSSSRRDSRDRDGRDKGSGRWTPDPDGQ